MQSRVWLAWFGFMTIYFHFLHDKFKNMSLKSLSILGHMNVACMFNCNLQQWFLLFSDSLLLPAFKLYVINLGIFIFFHMKVPLIFMMKQIYDL